MQSSGNYAMKNLMIYTGVFLLLIIILGIILVHFYKNVQRLNNETFVNSEYTKLNLYFLNTTKEKGVKIKNYGLIDNDDSSYFITFEKQDGTTNTFLKKGNIIYYNQVKLCEDVDLFKIIIDKSAKETISVEISISDKSYNLQYTLN
jgi:hypothetical protein